jgi:hypothetical protein
MACDKQADKTNSMQIRARHPGSAAPGAPASRWPYSALSKFCYSNEPFCGCTGFNESVCRRDGGAPGRKIGPTVTRGKQETKGICHGLHGMYWFGIPRPEGPAEFGPCGLWDGSPEPSRKEARRAGSKIGPAVRSGYTKRMQLSAEDAAQIFNRCSRQEDNP